MAQHNRYTGKKIKSQNMLKYSSHVISVQENINTYFRNSLFVVLTIKNIACI